MVDAPSWSRLAKLVTKRNKVQAIIDTAYMSTRFYFTGPPRGNDEQQAEQDLCYIQALQAASVFRGRDPFGLNWPWDFISDPFDSNWPWIAKMGCHSSK